MRTTLSSLIVLGALLGLPCAAKEPVNFTAEQDQRNMLDQLGIGSIRPGPSGDEKAPNAANTDEARANPYPNWPEILVAADGSKVSTSEQWWQTRRPQIVEAFEREVVGRVPANAPKVTWTVEASETEFINWKRVTATKLIAHLDNSRYPEIQVDVPVMLILPEGAAQKPVPVLIMFTWGAIRFPAPVQPQPEEVGRINAAMKAELVARDPSLAAVFAKYPGYDLVTPAPFPPPPGSGPEERIQQLVADGWGVALVNPTNIQADNGAGLTRGVIGLTNQGQPRKPEDWGALRAWAWGASRVLDYLETRPEVDAKHVGIEGVSRYGKAALVTMAFDQRFDMGLIGSAGEGGVSPYRRNYGEMVENLTGSGAYHWMAGNFLKYAGPKNANDLPVDSHMLIALAAPRKVFISYGVPEMGDAKWLDQQGSYMATVAAGSVWKLLGARDLGVGNDYQTAKMPPVLTPLLEGDLAWRQHDGGHTDAPNMVHFLKWADGKIGRQSAF
ncbi:acetyl xylan esterase [Asticcacaulis sp. AC460]|uniref:alpha/beta hydrolase family protein n=1 Tax=Asticcacaulis sp. AC460 TaxID=1282360 RepID=UPI0003C3D9F4|nr:hypothetical protein [Asticcacaulis sp. AC460]ESQ87209.1 acetyl xylan esterase [Asticcacaulis sp. AC460]